MNIENTPAELQTVEDLNKILERAQGQVEDKATYFTISLLLPPLSIYLALLLSYRKKLLFKTLPAQLIFYSAIIVVFNLVGLVGVSPPSSVVQLGITFDQKTSSQVTVLTVLTTVLAFVCLGLGFYFKNKAKKEGVLRTNSLWLLFFALNLLVLGMGFLMYKEVSLLFGSIAPVVNSGYQGL